MATIIKEILLIFVLTTDSFVVSFAYGMRKVKMPFKIVAGMNIIMSGLLGISLLTGSFLSDFLPKDVTTCLGAISSYRHRFIPNFKFFLSERRKQGNLSGTYSSRRLYAGIFTFFGQSCSGSGHRLSTVRAAFLSCGNFYMRNSYDGAGLEAGLRIP